jgi:NAD(P)-dependent dehydrogenase (short-subunit alcohol dehydrogenase family)
VIAGGTSGIGRGLVQRLANASPEQRPRLVVATTTREPSATPAQDLLRACPPDTVRVLHLDVTDEPGVSRMAEELASACGAAHHVDLLVYNAGVYGPRAAGALGNGGDELTAADFDLTFRTNATGAFLVVQALAKRGLLAGGDRKAGGTTRPFPRALLLDERRGRGGKSPGALPALRADADGGVTSIVALMSSVLASHGDELVSHASAGASPAYRASKAALNAVGLSLCVGGGLAERGVAVTTLHPGYVKGTNMTGDQGWLTVDESVDGLLALLTGGGGKSGGGGGGDGGGGDGGGAAPVARPLHARWWHAGTLEEIPW